MLARLGRLQQILGLLGRRPREQRIGRDPVGAAAEDFAAIDLQRKAAAGSIGRRDEFDRAEADLLGHRIRWQIDRQCIKRRLAAAGRPPEPRLVDLEDMVDHRLAGTDADVEANALAIKREM